MDADLKALIDRALAEDVGGGDITTDSTVDPTLRARAIITQKAAGVIYGLELAVATFRRLDPDVIVVHGSASSEGEWNEPGHVVLEVEGTARALLTGERVALNFLAHLSGIATATARIVRSLDALGEPHAAILDTRKTTPGLRLLEKAAVAAGGGVNHRTGLFDQILIKENHIAAAGGIGAAVARARAAHPGVPMTVEVRSSAEIDEALEVAAPRLLLDNMSPGEVEAAVAQVDGRAELEASGGMDAERVLVYATIIGLHYVSIGAITHSAPALDLSLALEAT